MKIWVFNEAQLKIVLDEYGKRPGSVPIVVDNFLNGPDAECLRWTAEKRSKKCQPTNDK